MNFKEFLNLKYIRLEVLAEAIGYSSKQIWLIRSGRQKPTKNFLRALEKVDLIKLKNSQKIFPLQDVLDDC